MLTNVSAAHWSSKCTLLAAKPNCDYDQHGAHEDHSNVVHILDGWWIVSREAEDHDVKGDPGSGKDVAESAEGTKESTRIRI